jgi:hypothetical protein
MHRPFSSFPQHHAEATHAKTNVAPFGSPADLQAYNNKKISIYNHFYNYLRISIAELNLRTLLSS